MKNVAAKYTYQDAKKFLDGTTTSIKETKQNRSKRLNKTKEEIIKIDERDKFAGIKTSKSVTIMF